MHSLTQFCGRCIAPAGETDRAGGIYRVARACDLCDVTLGSRSVPTLQIGVDRPVLGRYDHPARQPRVALKTPGTWQSLRKELFWNVTEVLQLIHLTIDFGCKE